MSESESIVAATAARIFADLADPQTLNKAKTDAWKAPLWRALEDAGLTLAWVPEEYGGAGASLADGFEILNIAGRFVAPVPLAETLLAGWLLSRAGLAVPAGVLTVAPTRATDAVTLSRDGTLKGRARNVPFAHAAGHIAVLAEAAEGTVVALVESRACRIVGGEGLAGDESSTVTFDGVTPLRVASTDTPANALMQMGAVARSLQTAGALSAILDMSVRYASERVAFERPIGKFQAVQHNLARLAGEAAAAMTAATSAADAIAQTEARLFDDGVFLEAASAKIRSGEAATEGAAIAHQVHGAIGYTQEHILHRFTLRMLAWRDDFGHESHWAVELGHRVAARGADEFWPLVASR